MLRKRSVLLAGHATSVSLEPAFWLVLDRVAAERGMSLAALLGELDACRGAQSLASAARVAALSWAMKSGSAGA